MRPAAKSRKPGPSRTARRVWRTIVRWLGRYSRLIILIVVTAVAAFLGYVLRPVNYPIPDSAPVHPMVDIMASRPGVTVTVSQALLSRQGVSINLTASTLSGSSDYTLYVEVSGVQVEWIYGEPQITPNWSLASDGDNTYSIGHSYALKASYSYNIPFSVSYETCDCVLVSGPYVAVNAISLDPSLLGPQKSVSSDGYTLTPVPPSGPFPGRAPGKYYATSLSSIRSDVVDLDTWHIPTSVSVMKAYPQVPDNPYLNTWEWNNVTSATLTLQDIGKQSALNGNWFYAGIFLGIAGSGVLALIPEVSEILKAIHEEKEAGRRRNRPIRRLGRRQSVSLVQRRAHHSHPSRSRITGAAMVKRRTTSARRPPRRRRGPHGRSL